MLKNPACVTVESAFQKSRYGINSEKFATRSVKYTYMARVGTMSAAVGQILLALLVSARTRGVRSERSCPWNVAALPQIILCRANSSAVIFFQKQNSTVTNIDAFENFDFVLSKLCYCGQWLKALQELIDHCPH
jgi:hypothetical protein